ncbi:uncharacterized protein LOC108511659 [Phoenix dactylifera]|uniref:Uncharacterized protein LOC108511659 n=1 Tax=Phoenix dactylifera TaxID=42345 RepID=A0A8B7MVZ3_PHODC|nr:uncharacterized protein LOC108511659 [Phoenix dactylifera]
MASLKKSNLSIAEYFVKLKKLSDELASAGHSLSNVDIESYLLAGLGSDYNPFVTMVTTRLDSLSLEELYCHLLTHESCLTHNNQPFSLADITDPSANVATRNSSTLFRSHGQGNRDTTSSYRFRGRGSNRGHGGRYSQTSQWVPRVSYPSSSCLSNM